MRKTLLNALAGILAVIAVGAARAEYIDWASGLGPLGIQRGVSTIGNFPGFYGGDFPGVFPIPLTPAEGAAAVLGAPDGRFLSLPGNEAADPTPSGSGFRWAFVDVVFGGGAFDATSDLYIHELGNNLESVYLFFWFGNGGNLQMVRTRGASDTIIVDLDPYAALAAANGGFTHVTLGGYDLLGASFGFDLDAVGVTRRVPEPATLALLAAALLGAAAWRVRPQATPAA
ncbi:MAG: PEP-CTERM sorting domain-containing protein [Burkholderiaceae bacterium]|nr:PEP-CTERM sorting domain-containing protein [Burkholderiaceae bacterium]